MSGDSCSDRQAGGLNPQALRLADAAKILSAAARTFVPVEKLEQDVRDGAPTNPDGTINLVHYASWLVKEMGR